MKKETTFKDLSDEKIKELEDKAYRLRKAQFPAPMENSRKQIRYEAGLGLIESLNPKTLLTYHLIPKIVIISLNLPVAANVVTTPEVIFSPVSPDGG